MLAVTEKKFPGLGLIMKNIEKVCLYVSLFSTALMMFLISVDALARYLLNSPIVGTYEITEDYLMVALVFLALSYTYTQGGHVRVTLFLRFVPPSIMAPINVFFNLLALGFFLLLTYGGWNIFIRAVHLGEFSSSILRYPLAPAYFLVPLGSFLLCVRLLQDTVLSLIGRKTLLETKEEF